MGRRKPGEPRSLGRILQQSDWIWLLPSASPLHESIKCTDARIFYGFIGNLETCALVAPNGSVDWLPFPHLEDASILAAILDPDRGGRFKVSPVASFEGSQRYVDTTNVLETTFRTVDGTATVTDFFPPAGKVDHPKKFLYRKVTCTEGSVNLEVEFEPRFDYGRVDLMFTSTEKGILAEGATEQTLLEAPTDLEIVDDRVTGALEVEEGNTEWLLLRCTGAEDADTDPEAALSETVGYWMEWVHSCSDEGANYIFEGPWDDLAIRSGLALKLLTHEETGAIAAAPTTSLPEDPGGVRNWDYRFNWLRDAGFTVQALSNLGNSEGALTTSTGIWASVSRTSRRSSSRCMVSMGSQISTSRNLTTSLGIVTLVRSASVTERRTRRNSTSTENCY